MKTDSSHQSEGSSFRDPAGFVFRQDSVVYRQIDAAGKEDYERLMSSGLQDELVEAGLLISHEEVAVPGHEKAYKIVKPRQLPFISYPYEWCFSQLKDAALVTLEIEKRALAHGMSLKDASAYNIQFVDGRPVFIDTLSFEVYEEKPWVAYRQFCQHFVAPLALMSYVDFRVGQLLRSYIDGIPLDLAARILPGKTRLLAPGLLMHVHLHAASQRKHAADGVAGKVIGPSMSKLQLLGLLESLMSLVKKLRWNEGKTEWGDYYQANNNYIDEAMAAKEKLVEEFAREIKPQTVWDLGGNTGRFSEITARLGTETVCWDIDPVAVEANYRHVRSVKNSDSESGGSVLPLWQDLTNPSPDLGWDLFERDSIIARGPADMVMALALIHHLAIANNVPLPMVARFLARLCRKGLIVEFIPKEDSQVQKLLASREDIFVTYTKEGFEKAFEEYFTIKQCELIKGSKRWLYLMKRRTDS